MASVTVTVFGSSRPQPGEPRYQQAFELGAAIGRRGWVLANGGYGGTMAASSAGAKQAGGTTIGVTCEVFGRGGASEFTDREIRTGDLPTRLARLIALGDSYVVLPGGTGTLSELAEVWELLNKGLVAGKCIVLLGDWWEPVCQAVQRDDPQALRLVHKADTPERAAEIIAGRLGVP
ncbi:MAG TPA: LOG family protein [Phycisphaerae bacterium]|nr:LOG family protein [Phycisphaerae bacterium]